MSQAGAFPISILYEDSDLLVLNKPPGMVVNDADSAPDMTLQSLLRQRLSHTTAALGTREEALIPAEFDAQYGTPAELFAQRDGMVHRLDKDTSGVLVWAQHPGALVALLKQFRERQVHKTYHCLVHGSLNPPEGSISAPIARRPGSSKLFGISSSGKKAITRYQTVGRFELTDELSTVFRERYAFSKKELRSYEQGFSLVACHPVTGRTHQLRVHLTSRQDPLVGDAQYGGRKRSRLDRRWCPRHFLHAARIEFKHPRTGAPLTVSAPLPPDLSGVISFLDAPESAC